MVSEFKAMDLGDVLKSEASIKNVEITGKVYGVAVKRKAYEGSYATRIEDVIVNALLVNKNNSIILELYKDWESKKFSDSNCQITLLKAAQEMGKEIIIRGDYASSNKIFIINQVELEGHVF